jgi:hypothetical protein
VLSKPFALALAVVARHGTFPLVSHSVSPDNEFAGSSRRKLWWILTPVGADNTGRGFLLLERILMLACQFVNMLAQINLTCLPSLCDHAFYG